ncbi:RHS repeat-associated core domain-containing protein, partial [Streptomyces sp. NPDC056948]|uniref:RHS repeat-associated core domain-containing protein n=1 Tax=Streptomyces sp. NPDC056948 TaxID=3345975 RepID=UPI003627D34A
GIQNRSWWEEVGDWFVDNWDTIVAVCKVVVAVVGIVAMIIGGPILGAIVLIAAAVVLADTLYKYSKGQASLWDVGFAALDCIPGLKGLTTLGGLAKGLKAFGKGGLKAMAKGFGKGLRREADDAAAKAKPSKGRCKNGDPIDMVSGEMLMEETDVELSGLLPLVLRRTHLSTYQWGRFFGPSWASTLDERLELDDEGAVFATEDGMLLFYPVPRPGTSVMPLEGPRWPLDWDGAPGAPLRITDPATGLTRHFAPGTNVVAVDEAFTLPLAAITDSNGFRIDFDRAADGTPVAVRDSGGRHVHVDTAEGRVVRLRLRNPEDGPDGTILRTFGYDPESNLTEIYNSSGLPRKLTYDDRARVTSWTDRNGYWYRFTYDTLDRCTSGEGAEGRLSCTIAYDSEVRETRYTDALGNTTTYLHNELGQLIAESDPLGHTTYSEWDRYGRLLSRTDELGNTTRFTLGEHGQPVRLDRPDGTSVEVEYSDDVLPVSVTDADGARWECTYDGRGNLLTSTDPIGAVSAYAYDERGHRIAQTDALGNTFRFETDESGLPVRVVDPRGSVVTLRRNAFGRVVRSNDPVGGTVRQGWDPEGRLLWRERAEGGRETWSYDAEGNLTVHCDAGGFTTTFEYGGFDLPSSRTDPDGTRYRFAHDAELRLVGVINPRGDEWSYRYDEASRLIGETDFNGRSLGYVHDATGRQIERTNGTGQKVRLTRDAAGRVVTSRTDDGAVTALRYDVAGRLIEAANLGGRVAYGYDAVGRIVGETVDGRTVTSEYDPLGRRVRRTTPSGATSHWAYDAAGLPTSLVTAGGELTFTHDAAGREIARDLAGAAMLTQTWDAGHRLVEQVIRSGTAGDAGHPGATVQQARSYTYRGDGHVTSITDRLGATRRFGLDRAGRVTQVSAETWTESYAYDELGNLARAAHPASGAEDAQGPVEHSGTRVTAAGRATYEHDDQGRVLRVIRRTLSGLRRIWTYVWDADDRLTEAVTPDSGVWRYRYDVLGRRTAKWRVAEDGSVAEEVLFTWDCANLAEQQTHRDGLVETDTWDWEPGTHRAAAQVRRRWRTDAPDTIDRQFYAIVTDLVGTPSELVGEDGVIAWRAATTLWGRPLAGDEGGLCPLAFPGQYRDAETGLHYNLARYYDPDTASYLSPDPLGLVPGPNHHAYVDNPLRWSDPLGLEGDSTEPVRVYDDSSYSKHGSGSSSSAKGEVSRAPSNGQAALDRSIDMDPNNPSVTRRLGVDHANNEIVVLDRHRAITDNEGNIIKEIYHGHVQSSYPSKSITQGDLTKLKKAGMIDNVKKQRVLPPPCDG